MPNALCEEWIYHCCSIFTKINKVFPKINQICKKIVITKSWGLKIPSIYRDIRYKQIITIGCAFHINALGENLHFFISGYFVISDFVITGVHGNYNSVLVRLIGTRLYRTLVPINRKIYIK